MCRIMHKVHPPCTTSVKLRSLSSTELLATQKNVSNESLSVRLLSVYCTFCKFESSHTVRFNTSTFPKRLLLLISTNVAGGIAFALQKRGRLVPTFLLTLPAASLSSVRNSRSGATRRVRKKHKKYSQGQN